VKSALYYPHTEIKNENLLKTALLLWDQVYVIAPWPDYQPQYDSQDAGDAFALIGHCHFPTEDEKRHAHELVKDFAKRPLPAAFTLSELNSRSELYEISPRKLLPETWELLEHCRLVDGWRRTRILIEAHRSKNQGGLAGQSQQLRGTEGVVKNDQSFEVTDAVTPLPTGLSLMAILADCCAGNTLARITDRGGAYATLTGLLLEESDEELEIDSAREQLVPIPMRVVAGDEIPMKSLVDLRKREAGNADGSSIRDLRHRFADKIETQAKRLSTAKSSLERSEIVRDFEQDIQDDYRELREALKSKTFQALGTKDVLMSVLVGASTIAAAAITTAVSIPGTLTWSGAAMTIGGLLSAKSKLAEERTKVLKDHPTAYIYESLGGIRW
jgi:hypothetical protein